MILATITLTALASRAASTSGVEAPNILPLPARVEMGGAEGFLLNERTSISAPTSLKGEAVWLADRLRAGAKREVPTTTAGGSIRLSIDPAQPKEGYRLSISKNEVLIRGGSSAGVFYGAVTFLQCLPAAAFGDSRDETLKRAGEAWSAPSMVVEDAPATSWRGVLLDSARHFQPKKWIFKFLDAMATYKLNVLHWHLVDNEAWRLEIKKYPKLTKVHRDYPERYVDEIPTNPTTKAVFRYGYFHGGGYYTQTDVKEIVAYAAARHIAVVPEIEFPGHSQAVLTAYPEFGTTRKVPTIRSNHSPDLIGVHTQALRFLHDVLDETMDLFPGEYLHFGGDEAPKAQWKGDAYVQRRIDELGLRLEDPKGEGLSEAALQAWMFNQMAAYVGKRGRKAVGWEEIMHGQNLGRLTKGSVVMPWLSVQNGAIAANAGYGVVHVATFPFYLDSYQSDDPREPGTLYGGPQTPDLIYGFDLFPKELTPEGRRNVLGAEATLWTELMPRTDDIEYQAFPRLCSLAELTWTAADCRRSPEMFLARLAAQGGRLSALGLNHRHLPPSPSLGWSPAFLQGGGVWEVPLSREVVRSLANGGELRVSFAYLAGAHGLTIREVTLWAGGTVLAHDAHEGFAGSRFRENVYTLRVPPGPEGRALNMRIAAKGDGGNDSAGNVRLETLTQD